MSDTAETVECLRQMLDEVRQILEAVKAPRSVTANMVWPEQEAPRVESAIERDRVVAEHVSEQTAIMLRNAANGEKNLKLQEELVEAVRALRREPDHSVRAILNERDEARAEVERLRAEVTAVRESLERATRVNDQLRAERDLQRAELESFREAQTGGLTLMDVGKLKQELETERHRLAACGVAALGYFEGCCDEYKSASLSDVLKIRAELKRFREREGKLDELFSFMLENNLAPEAHYLVEAVRDFKASEPKPATRAELHLRKYGPYVQAQWEWYEQREHAVRGDAAFCADQAISDVLKWEAMNPKPQGET